MKKSLLIHFDSLEVLDDLTIEQAGELLFAIRDYTKGEEPNLNGLMKAVFTPFKNQFERDNIKYIATVERNRINGSKGGRPKTQVNPNNPVGLLETQPNPSKPKKADKDNGSVNDNVKDNVNVKLKERKEQFKKLLLPFENKYSKELLKNFYGYWSEHGIKDKKMRFEKEKSFGISRRLTTWQKNDDIFNPPKSNNKVYNYDNAEEEAEF